MQQARGYMTKLTADFESDFGVAPSKKAGKILPFNKCELKASQTIINPATITGRRDPVEPARGHIDVKGNVEIPIDATAFGYWLKGMFGSPTTVADADGKHYKHVFRPSNEQPSLVINKEFPDIGEDFLYSGCKINTFKTTVGDDGELTAQMELIGANETVGTTTYDSAATAVTLDRLNNFQAVLKEDGKVTANIKTVDLEFNLGLDSNQYVLGSIGRGGIPEGLFTVSGTIKAIFNDISTINKGINATETSLELILTADDKSLTITLPEVQYERTSPVISGPAGATAEFKFSAYFKDSNEGNAVVATLVNTTASY